MSFHKIELFGHVVYSSELSYDDLLAKEERVKILIQNVLEDVAGEFIHFEALGDTLRFQCVLPEEREAVFQSICDSLAPEMQGGLDARLLLVDKSLDSLYFYSIVNGKWQEAVMALPAAGYLAEAQAIDIAKVAPKGKNKNE